MNAKREDGKTPLHDAVEAGLRANVELLLNAGADVKALWRGLTPRESLKSVLTLSDETAEEIRSILLKFENK